MIGVSIVIAVVTTANAAIRTARDAEMLHSQPATIIDTPMTFRMSTFRKLIRASPPEQLRLQPEQEGEGKDLPAAPARRGSGRGVADRGRLGDRAIESVRPARKRNSGAARPAMKITIR